MSSVERYLFIVAPDVLTANSMVESDLDDWMGREFYDGFEVIEGKTRPVSKIEPSYISISLEAVENLLKSKREEAEKAHKAGDRSAEGFALIIAGKILCEWFFEDMPWFNVEQWNWSVPTAEDEKQLPDKCRYWAVKVKFYL